ncbi:MAG: anaerobic carbon-monoxide dehydrogenase catalytic subunit [Candidatus Omnitrophota bacterium]|nr:anaerobic carbon-monoxide dehydrogenase catalytic subunit [Candidatus Omnitrophota bacterium]
MSEEIKKYSGDAATQQMRRRAEEEGVVTIWDREALQEPHCGFGTLGVCCKNCNLGPCRIDPFGEGATQGVCGATAEVIAARNLVRHIAAGSACHNDHGREITKTLLMAAEGKTKFYQITSVDKLKSLANEFKIKTDNRKPEEIAIDVAKKIFSEYGQQEGEISLIQRAPEKQKKIWRKFNLMPRGIDREVVECLTRTNIGVDNDYQNLMMQGMRTALSDGWGGSMVATELSDILFGKPSPQRARVNLGVLKHDEVNLLVHGHVPVLSEMICNASTLPEMIEYAKQKGANGINVAGLCCTANEVLVRRGFPVAGNFLQQELALLTGAVDLLLVDLQCIMPSLPEIAHCFHTKIVSTSPKAKFPGMEHIEFKEEEALPIAKQIVKMAIDNYPNRDKARVCIPDESKNLVPGFTTEYVFDMLGGKYRSTFRPLNDAIINGRIRGVAGVVGCDNPKMESGDTHLKLVKELIKNDVLVVQTGCSALACAKAGLLTPEAAYEFAGKGLREICEAVGIPPVLHLGACVDNSRILTACIEMVKEGGLGEGLDDLPIAGAAPEWMSEKAIAIGWYFVASGALVVFGMPFPVYGSPEMTRFVTEDVEKITGGKWAFEPDPLKMAQIMIEHINKKRAALRLQPMMYEK